VKILSFCCLLLGFNSCDNEEGGDWVEYGSPSARYKVNGKVVSAEEPEKGIENIQVVLTLPEEDEYIYWGDTVYTDRGGVFEINHADFPSNKIVIKFEDVDGVENGLFTDKSETVTLKKEDYKDGGSWYKGMATIDLGTVRLEPKEEVEDPEENEED